MQACKRLPEDSTHGALERPRVCVRSQQPGQPNLLQRSCITFVTALQPRGAGSQRLCDVELNEIQELTNCFFEKAGLSPN